MLIAEALKDESLVPPKPNKNRLIRMAREYGSTASRYLDPCMPAQVDTSSTCQQNLDRFAKRRVVHAGRQTH
jgi:hypothetical protein